MDNMTIWQLGELLRAGWRVQVVPVPSLGGRSTSQVMLQFIHKRSDQDPDEDDFFPVTDWLSLSGFEANFGQAIDRFYGMVFPTPDVTSGLQA